MTKNCSKWVQQVSLLVMIYNQLSKTRIYVYCIVFYIKIHISWLFFVLKTLLIINTTQAFIRNKTVETNTNFEFK